MTWQDLECGWQTAFTKAWEAFCSGTIPVGAAIFDENGNLVSSGQNMVYIEQGEGPALYGNNLAHAEINAIVQLKRKEHPNIRAYTLYTTTEPCILCFGAIVMGNVRHCKYAARDRYAGAARYTEHSDYVKSKNIQIEGPHDILEAVQIALHTYFELDKSINRYEHILSQMTLDCPQGVLAGRELFKKGVLQKLAEEQGSAEEAYGTIWSQLKKIIS
ncbi:MAG: nucleoside deaminase [Clostridia bacterium]